MSLTRDEIEALMDGIGEAIRTNVMNPTDTRLRAIEQKLGLPSPPSNGADDLAAQILAAMDEQQ
jgi:hypothetical protein